MKFFKFKFNIFKKQLNKEENEYEIKKLQNEKKELEEKYLFILFYNYFLRFYNLEKEKMALNLEIENNKKENFQQLQEKESGLLYIYIY